MKRGTSVNSPSPRLCLDWAFRPPNWMTCVQILKYVTRNVQKVLDKSFLIYPKMTRDDDMMLQNSKGWEELLIHSEKEVINLIELWVSLPIPRRLVPPALS